ncbi:RNB domain-containing ribonuclease [Galactobacter valiniphilus]|uniref:RNB domain-containing ribonuclease n=1 Tax=Galactobacter valiniphilus TaxID=2676122 RepID=UPI003736DB8F
MRHAYLRLSEAATALRDSLETAAAASGLSADYPPAAVAEAEAAVSAYALPELDLLGIPFVTIDPEGSTDLDQALWIEDEGTGWRVHYAIADVPGFVPVGTELDAETRRRGETAYLPQGRIPLHPEVISEGAGSLLEGQERGAYVWELLVAADGASTLVSLRHARVRSREQLSYPEAQRRLEAGDALMLRLHAFGEARRADEARRGGANLGLPEQEIVPAEGGGYRLRSRVPLPIEEDNAQVSLLTGITAAAVMLEAGVGLLRTMPAPDPEAERRFRQVTARLGHPWEQGQGYGAYLRTLDVSDPRQLAIMHAAGGLFRGAGYTAFDGVDPAQPQQAAVAAPYAHVTAPLRRLVDRFGLVLCHAHVNAAPIPAWVREALPTLPEAMKAAGSAVNSAERRSLDIVEAFLLQGREGERFEAVVTEGRLPSPAASAPQAPQGTPAAGPRSTGSVKVTLLDPPVEARAEGVAESGSLVTLELVSADIASATIRLRVVDPA